MNRVNQDLSLDNESMMFVTLFFGILNTATGEVEYCNAGHNSPLLLSAAGMIAPLQPTGGVALGVAEECVYRSRKIAMQKGDALFLYTDGVTEAMDKREELFSEDRLVQELVPLNGKPLKEIVSGIMGDVETFSEGVPQADDITLLVIRYLGGK
jgi:sigma-B regulation protein RsbU (phosphoserine phosphatase)